MSPAEPKQQALAPAPTQLSASSTDAAVPSSGTGPAATHTPVVPRPRQQGRKKAIPIEPDSLYRATPASLSNAGTLQTQGHAVAGSKRSAGDRERVDGEPRKRKRVDAHAYAGSNVSGLVGGSGYLHAHSKASASAHGQGGPSSRMGSAIGNVTAANSTINSNGVVPTSAADADGQTLFEFSTLSTSALYEYISQFDLVPVIYPTPLTAEDPPPPVALLDPARMASRAPSPTPVPVVTAANRPRRTREAKDASRRRSTRLLSEELRCGGPEPVPVLADVGAVHGVLASIAARHYRESAVREVDTLMSFIGAVKARR